MFNRTLQCIYNNSRVNTDANLPHSEVLRKSIGLKSIYLVMFVMC
jgi:hypothetical protein